MGRLTDADGSGVIGKIYSKLVSERLSSQHHSPIRRPNAVSFGRVTVTIDPEQNGLDPMAGMALLDDAVDSHQCSPALVVTLDDEPAYAAAAY